MQFQHLALAFQIRLPLLDALLAAIFWSRIHSFCEAISDNPFSIHKSRSEWPMILIQTLIDLIVSRTRPFQVVTQFEFISLYFEHTLSILRIDMATNLIKALVIQITHYISQYHL